ncbi:MAG TPA: MFS transporter [Solirubrobacteraceae bacterium]|nr:MFS transporter [Solirubrobacteraceae bacterium]
MDQRARGRERRDSRRTAATVVLLATGAGYGGGNVGPVTDAIAGGFGVSLSAVGLTMTVFFATITAVTLGSAQILRRLGPRVAIALCCVLSGLGNVVCAISPSFAGVLVGRGVVGVGAGLAFVIGPVVARSYGGARLIGAFGAAVTLGIAVALGLGSALADAGVSWRVAFWISALIGAAALATLPRRLPSATVGQPRRAGFVRAALAMPAMWRLTALFIAANGITIVVSSWLIQYLVNHGQHRWFAGVLGFELFAVTAAVREFSGKLAVGSGEAQRLAAGGPLLTAAGLAGLAVDAGALPALAWVTLMGAGFALPYALVIERAQRLFPDARAEVMAVLQTGPNVVPMAVIPAVGAALDAGHGAVAWLALAAYLVVAAALNLRAPQPAPAYR